MILDPSGAGPVVSNANMKQAYVLQTGQAIYVEAVAAMIAQGRVLTLVALEDAATKAVQAAATYISLAEASAQGAK